MNGRARFINGQCMTWYYYTKIDRAYIMIFVCLIVCFFTLNLSFGNEPKSERLCHFRWNGRFDCAIARLTHISGFFTEKIAYSSCSRRHTHFSILNMWSQNNSGDTVSKLQLTIIGCWQWKVHSWSRREIIPKRSHKRSTTYLKSLRWNVCYHMRFVFTIAFAASGLYSKARYIPLKNDCDIHNWNEKRTQQRERQKTRWMNKT